MTRHAFTAAAFLALSACATVPAQPAPGSELVGRTMRVELPGGEATILSFNADGTVLGSSGGPQASGRWMMEPGRICMEWPRLGRECYPYAGHFVRGRTVTLTGTSGAAVRATLQ